MRVTATTNTSLSFKVWDLLSLITQCLSSYLAATTATATAIMSNQSTPTTQGEEEEDDDDNNSNNNDDHVFQGDKLAGGSQYSG